MLINSLSNITFNRFINFINNIFSSIFIWIFIFFIISILIRISFLKTKSIKNISNNFTKLAIISFIFTFISNLSILLVLNIFIQFSFEWIERSTINLLNFIFLLFVIFFSATKTKYFNFIVLFNKLIVIFFLIIFAPVIFDAFLKTENNLFHLILWVIGYGSLISTIVINNNVMEVKQIFRKLSFGFILLLLCLILNLYFIENTNDIKLSTIFKNIFMIILLWIYVWNVVLINKNNTKTQNKKKNNEDLNLFVLVIKNNCLIMDKPIKYTTIFINGYKRVMKI
ncbi:hypothetical protein [Spiroplasma melliferum]|uniref:Transmembrane protein n=2 Tax=Spiroplasma melliferum TaxID=2134 RepID=A0AAI9T3L3_SPIME|nr:hypothetical protein [Spiroplasma melliferum]ELL44676.1 hypothetical protein SMIPMB4A_v3c2940 [Spiroplasma melliferum IPMB4A]KAI92847.1 hypothetical protein SPM_002260 [Spiroplasma melliferum KC3]QCO24485.1 hypothetical protein SRED_002982 [Spiroplasma melliferum]